MKETENKSVTLTNQEAADLRTATIIARSFVLGRDGKPPEGEKARLSGSFTKLECLLEKHFPDSIDAMVESVISVLLAMIEGKGKDERD